MMRVWRRAAWLVIFAVTMSVSLWLYPVAADGPFAIHDGIWSGIKAEHNPAASIVPHHPLFHILVLVVVQLVRAGSALNESFTRVVASIGVGHIAVRIVSGLGAFAILWLVARGAGPRRWIVGMAFAAVFISCRGSIIEAATGENVLPAVAAALAVVHLAAREKVRLLPLGVALVVALLFRQDNVFILPGVIAATALGLPVERRWWRILRWLASCGLITLALYVVIWRFSAEGEPRLGEWQKFIDWIRELGKNGPWTGRDQGVGTLCAIHLDSLAAAIIGRHWPETVYNLWIGPAHAALVILAGLLMRGTGAWPGLLLVKVRRWFRPERGGGQLTAPDGEPVGPVRLGSAGRFVLAATLTLWCRFPFFAWFEANNPEWMLLPLAFVAAVGARFAAGAPRSGHRSRALGFAILVLLAAGTVVKHLPNTLELRKATLMSVVDEALRLTEGKCRILAVGYHVSTALRLRDVQNTILPDVPGDPNQSLMAVQQELAAHPVPTVVIVNRLVRDGMPYTMAKKDRWALDDLPDTDLYHWYRRDGLVFAVRFTPPGASSR